MKKQLFFLVSLAVSVLSPAVWADTSVYLTSSATGEDFQLNYSDKVRLGQVLQDSLNILPLKEPVYWLGAALFDNQDTSIKQNTSTIITALSFLSEHSKHPQTTQSFNELSATLKAITLQKRLFIPLDYDLVRIQTKSNPMLNGNYRLTLPLRPKNILILGAIEQSGFMPWQERFDAQAYLKQAQVLSSANNSFAWVIQPDGLIELHPIAKWNEQHMDIAPGAIIYLGYRSLPSNFASFNEDLVELLRNKAP